MEVVEPEPVEVVDEPEVIEEAEAEPVPMDNEDMNKSESAKLSEESK